MSLNRHEVIQRYISGIITDAEAQALELELEENKALRDEYLDALNLDSALEAAAESAQTALNLAIPVSVSALAQTSVLTSSWFSWRPVSAAAVGLVIGLFSASIVWAYVSPRREGKRVPLRIANAGFEEPSSDTRTGFPVQSKVWAGDEVRTVRETDGIEPIEGVHMGRLAPVKIGERQFSYVYQIVELETGIDEARQVEVSVAFHAAQAGTAHRYALRIAGFAETAQNIRPLWRESMEAATAATQRAVTTPAEYDGWKILNLKLELPPYTRSIVIAIGARSLDAFHPLQAHYIDDVKVSLVTPSIPRL